APPPPPPFESSDEQAKRVIAHQSAASSSPKPRFRIAKGYYDQPRFERMRRSQRQRTCAELWPALSHVSRSRLQRESRTAKRCGSRFTSLKASFGRARASKRAALSSGVVCH